MICWFDSSHILCAKRKIKMAKTKVKPQTKVYSEDDLKADIVLVNNLKTQIKAIEAEQIQPATKRIEEFMLKNLQKYFPDGAKTKFFLEAGKVTLASNPAVILFAEKWDEEQAVAYMEETGLFKDFIKKSIDSRSLAVDFKTTENVINELESIYDAKESLLKAGIVGFSVKKRFQISK